MTTPPIATTADVHAMLDRVTQRMTDDEQRALFSAYEEVRAVLAEFIVDQRVWSSEPLAQTIKRLADQLAFARRVVKHFGLDEPDARRGFEQDLADQAARTARR